MQKLLYLLSVTSLFSLDVYQTPPFHACLMISYIGTHIFRISFDANIGYIFNITKYLDIFLDIFSKYLCDSWF